MTTDAPALRSTERLLELDKLLALTEQAETWAYLWRWVERGLFDKTSTPTEALEVMLFHPAAPWNNGAWDVTHKPYADRFYAKFPNARPAILGDGGAT